MIGPVKAKLHLMLRPYYILTGLHFQTYTYGIEEVRFQQHALIKELFNGYHIFWI